jgi:hypothetical protein
VYGESYGMGDGGGWGLICLHRHDHAGLYRCSLGGRGRHRPPTPWALLDIRVVGLGLVAIVPVERGPRCGSHRWWGLDVHAWGWRDHHGWRGLPVWPPGGSEGDHKARPDEDPRPSMPMRPPMPTVSKSMPAELMPLESMASIPVSPVPMPLQSVPSEPMAATLCVPWHAADHEQPHQNGECRHPLPPRSHRHHPALRAPTHMFPGSVPTISRRDQDRAMAVWVTCVGA